MTIIATLRAVSDSTDELTNNLLQAERLVDELQTSSLPAAERERLLTYLAQKLAEMRRMTYSITETITG